MTRAKLSSIGLVLLGLLIAAPPTVAKDYVYGAMVRDNHGIAAQAVIPFFDELAKETGGAIQFKFVGANQVVNARTTSPGISKRIVDAGLVVPIYSRKTYPNSNVMFDMQAFGSDTVAMAGTTLETLMLKCPECLEDWKKAKQVFLANYSVSPFMVMCKDPVPNAAWLKGKKIRVSGANGRFAKVLGAVTVNMPPSDGVQAMQRGALDCAIGSVSWLTGYGFIDVVKHVVDYPLGALGMVGLLVVNRDVWNGFTPEQRQLILSKQPKLAASGTVHGYMKESERVRALAIEKGISFKSVDLGPALKKHRENEMKFVPSLSKKMGAKNPEAIMQKFLATLPKWEKLSPGIGTDVDKFAAALKEHVYDKVDPNKL